MRLEERPYGGVWVNVDGVETCGQYVNVDGITTFIEGCGTEKYPVDGQDGVLSTHDIVHLIVDGVLTQSELAKVIEGTFCQ